MSQETELKPCPICNGTVMFKETHRRHYQIQCTNCTLEYGSGQDKEKIGREWNTRHAPDDKLRKAAEEFCEAFNFTDDLSYMSEPERNNWRKAFAAFSKLETALSTPEPKEQIDAAENTIRLLQCALQDIAETEPGAETVSGKPFNPKTFALSVLNLCKPLSESEVGKPVYFDSPHAQIATASGIKSADKMLAMPSPEQPQGQVGATALQKVREALENSQSWLSACLKSPHMKWDGDQHAAATQTVQDVTEALSLISQCEGDREIKPELFIGLEESNLADFVSPCCKSALSIEPLCQITCGMCGKPVKQEAALHRSINIV